MEEDLDLTTSDRILDEIRCRYCPISLRESPMICSRYRLEGTKEQDYFCPNCEDSYYADQERSLIQCCECGAHLTPETVEKAVIPVQLFSNEDGDDDGLKPDVTYVHATCSAACREMVFKTNKKLIRSLQGENEIPTHKICRNCGASGKYKKCAGCMEVAYCSKPCQKENWTDHKKECQKRRP